MATNRIETSTALISTEAITFIRSIQIKLTGKLLRPNTVMHVFFDKVLVDRFVTPNGLTQGAELTTDSNGNFVAILSIPGFTFTTGEKEILIIDSDQYNSSQVSGSSSVLAKAIFKSTGILEKYRTTETTVNTVVVEEIVRIEVPTVQPINVARGDPLAQSFFTFGVDGGCWVTGLDLYFQTKDTTLPVWVELRTMKNGFPTETLATPHSKCVIQASAVAISQNASLPTRFTFEKMVYLSQDSDFCFVIRSNSKSYNVWTAKLGEKSIETGKTVFEQPYNGSLFKSENNYTWSPEQNEDIKFVLYKAQFNTAVQSTLKFGLDINSRTLSSTAFSTLEDSPYVFAQLSFQHGLDINSKIAIGCDVTSTYNGIPGSLLNGEHQVFSVLSEYVIGFVVTGANATKSGSILTGGKVSDIQIDDEGTGYTIDQPPTILITGDGVNAVASPVISNGKIIDILVTNNGSGYTTPPLVSFVGLVGAGASGTAIIDEYFNVTTNATYHTVGFNTSMLSPPGSKITSTLKTTQGSYEGGSVANYSAGQTYDIQLDKENKLNSNCMIASRYNENLLMGNNRSAELEIKFSSNNKNVSPVLDMSVLKGLFVANSINNQKMEVVESPESRGSVATIQLVNGGSGYTYTPDVLIYDGIGVGATATATVVGGVVTTLILDTNGSGYLYNPKVKFVPPTSGLTPPTTEATAVTTITEFNSELHTDLGRALSRYVTKRQTLQAPANGIKVFVEAYSNSQSSFEFYARTSLSIDGTAHDSREWTQLKCDISRNKSTEIGQAKEYEFYLDDISDFDVFSFKIVLRTLTPWDPPVINNYRAIMLS